MVRSGSLPLGSRLRCPNIGSLPLGHAQTPSFGTWEGAGYVGRPRPRCGASPPLVSEQGQNPLRWSASGGMTWV